MTTPIADAISRECDALKALLLEKNRCYGNSALDPLRVFSTATPEEQILVRIDDKLSRIARGSEFAGDDTVQDLLGYLILLRIARRAPAATEQTKPVVSSESNEQSFVPDRMRENYPGDAAIVHTALKELATEVMRARIKFPLHTMLGEALAEEVGEWARGGHYWEAPGNEEALHIACVALRIYIEGTTTPEHRILALMMDHEQIARPLLESHGGAA